MTQAGIQALEAGVALFHQPKPEGDIDMVGEVRAIMISAGRLKAITEHFDNDHYIRDAVGKKSEVQRHLLNMYWHLQLSMAPNSLDVRYMLLPNGTMQDWLTMFKTAVLPFIISHDLPRAVRV